MAGVGWGGGVVSFVVPFFLGFRMMTFWGIGKKRNLFMQREKRLLGAYVLGRWTFSLGHAKLEGRFYCAH